MHCSTSPWNTVVFKDSCGASCHGSLQRTLLSLSRGHSVSPVCDRRGPKNGAQRGSLRNPQATSVLGFSGEIVLISFGRELLHSFVACFTGRLRGGC